MSDDNPGLSANPMFGAMIGQQIANNRVGEMHAQHASDMARAMQETNEAAVRNSEASLNLVTSYIEMRDRLHDLEREVSDLEASDSGFSLAIAGVRGVTRELLSELRKADPKNPMLEKKVRDKIFDSAKINQEKLQIGKPWRQRDEDAPQYRDIAYGAPGSNKGGPEKSKITSNTAVRAEAGVPDHVTDRERFMSLIKELHSTLSAKDPNAPILKSQTMFDVLTEYDLNEMDRQPNSGGESMNGTW